MQVPVLAKADSMTLEELRQFRKYIRSQLEQVPLLDLPEQHLLCISLASRGNCMGLLILPDNAISLLVNGLH